MRAAVAAPVQEVLLLKEGVLGDAEVISYKYG